MADLVRRVVDALEVTLPPTDGAIPLHEPALGPRERELVLDALDSGWVSSVGAYVTRFEEETAKYTGARHAVVTVNGTAALHLALHVAGVTRDDEVLAPALTFAATAHAILYTGATPHFVDVEERTFGVCPKKLADYLERTAEQSDGVTVNKHTGRRIAALVVVHVFGHPARMKELARVANAWGLPLVEDAAEALGTTLDGRHVGTMGRVGVLSFNGNKIVTTGGGGMLLTDDDALAARAKHVSQTAKVAHRWEYVHDELGFNYRMPNLNAALGCAQLERMPSFLASKRRLFERYRDAFAAVPGVSILAEPEGARSNYWLNALVLDEGHEEHRDAIIEACHARGWLVRPVWKLLHELPHLRGTPSADLSVARSLSARTINLPSSASLCPDASV